MSAVPAAASGRRSGVSLAAPDTAGLISTNPARCRDCYRCVRTCPVKAVRVRGGQAEVVSDLCIACASCVRACPQRAKVVRDGVGPVKAALAAGRTVVASVAPSAPARFPMASFAQMQEALAALGFTAAGETALGAEMTGQAHGELVEQDRQRWPLIASSCPVVVNLIEQYYPDLLPHLAPIVSPMIAHGRYLRQVYGPAAFIVFVGPCIAKKGEAAEPALSGAIDAVLTYTELEQWLSEAGVAFPAPQGRAVEAIESDSSPLRPLPAIEPARRASACRSPSRPFLAPVPARGRPHWHRSVGDRAAVQPLCDRFGDGDVPEHVGRHPVRHGASLPGRAHGLPWRVYQRPRFR